MEITQLENAVYDRLVGDTGAGSLVTLLGSGTIYSAFAPEKATRPYVVLWVTIPTIDLAFNLDVANVEIFVEVYVDRYSNAAAQAGTIQSIIDRIYGDSIAGSAPTYGLHRWKPTLTGNWSGDTIVATSALPQHDEDVVSYTLRFEMIQSR